MDKRQILVEVASGFANKFLGDKLTCAYEKLGEIINNIPEEYRSSTILKFDTEYEDHLINFSIYYYREETDEEFSKRIADIERRKQASIIAAQEREKMVLRQLAAKYPEVLGLKL